MHNNKTLSPERTIHGAFDFAELARLNLSPDDIVDFSVNANPYGPSPRVREAIVHTTLDRYPDRDSLQLRQTILQYELVKTRLTLASIICGNGASELIWAVARTFLRPGAKAIIIGPTFGEYRTASQAAGACVSEMQAPPENNFRHNLDTLLARLYAEKPRLVWLCNPNNPSGTWLDKNDIFLIVESCHKMNAVLVIDESYLHFVWPYETSSTVDLLRKDIGASMIILRSLTKDFALAGLRLGYGVGSSEIIERVTAQLPSWNVSSLAQDAGNAALADREHLDKTLTMLGYEREAFFAALLQANLQSVPSRTHFCLIKVGNAQQVRQKLLMRGILVRDCTSFGLPQFIRVATRLEHEWQRLLASLLEVL